MPEDNNNLDDLSIEEILNLYKDTLTTEDNIISLYCPTPPPKAGWSGVRHATVG